MSLEFSRIGHSFTDPAGHIREILKDVQLKAPADSFVSIIGPSGSGKTTLLKITARLISPSEGAVFANGTPVGQTTIKVGYVPQNHTLFPWLTVSQNVSFGLRFSRLPQAIVERKAHEILEEVRLREFADYYPDALSGGMAQRVSLARALVIEPDILLMDEPLGSLDSQTRAAMEEHVLSIWSSHKITVLFVTHDIAEAVYLSDRVALLSGSPATISEVFEVGLARPRKSEMKRSTEFDVLVTKIGQAFSKIDRFE